MCRAMRSPRHSRLWHSSRPTSRDSTRASGRVSWTACAGDAATHLLPVLQKRLGGDHSVILSGANWVDVMKPGVNKGRAMRMLQEIKGVSPDECMAFGDYLNDWELLQSVTESYAMENALPELKAIAKHIAPPNDDRGVMRVVKERFGV